jgi:hypothetical protein
MGVSSEGFNDGLLFGLPLFVNTDICEHGSDPSLWAGYIAGAVVSAGTLGLGAVAETEVLASEETSSVGIATNKAAGDAARDEILAENHGAEKEQSFNTALGVRRVDVLTTGRVAIESKVGRTSLTPTVELQIAKDRLLVQSGKVNSVEWAFTPSGVTGQVGPTGPLADALQKAGIGWTERP